ncbi:MULTISPECIES: phosphatase PAP2 family protein [unclassified Clostridium]|uniref:phosphatase PAP2 family protein n=1 Tax=Clostridium TaxID=1485 RepID=UPI001C8C3679|nr:MULTISPECIES: phosphatase PAP2 family protein [unclassified Clostridium]MBX9137810.1 phosphatase PAP2 family protein [Clostridium sp. K12(2020)]MBX9143535.1 phosphatase PAP2 family protein [Clostridium sp. K13]MDU2290189.1 phosphatase PAP2 family protein [Clostridium celatum]MDU4324107.1 phosphatase PAP2 family protein [Clostridium celatum]
MVKFFKAIDNKGLKYISEKCQNRTFDKMMPIITMMGNLGVIWFVISSLMFLKVEYRIIGIGVILAVALTTIIGEGIIKHIVRRSRPFQDKEEKLLINKPITYSFPSGHTASSFAALAVFLQMNGKLGLIVSPIATLIAFSRVYLKVHYPTDVIFGMLLGFTCGITVVSFLGRMVF